MGVDGGWLPLPNRPQQYCDTLSLVLRLTVRPVGRSVALPIPNDINGFIDCESNEWINKREKKIKMTKPLTD